MLTGWKETLLYEAVCRHTVKAILNSEMTSEAFKLDVIEAYRAVVTRCNAYMGNYFLPELILRILYKKCLMLENARTKAELKDIVKPSLPRKRGNGFYEGPYHVKEEELLLWSLASLEAPLNADGAKRYKEVFTRFFPEESQKIWN